MIELENDTLEIMVSEDIHVSDQNSILPKLNRVIKKFLVLVSEIFENLQASVGVNHFALPPNYFVIQNGNI